ncbi:MAG: PAS domain-containing protein [Pseudohaliea sp.]
MTHGRDDLARERSLSGRFAERLRQLERSLATGAPENADFRRLAAGLCDAADRLGLETLARDSRRLLSGATPDPGALRGALPTAEALAERLAAAAGSPSPGGGVQLPCRDAADHGEPALLLLSRNEPPARGLAQLFSDPPRGPDSRRRIVTTPAEAVATVQGWPDVVTVLLIDEDSFTEPVTARLGAALGTELQAGRLAMVLLTGNRTLETLQRAGAAGCSAVESPDRGEFALGPCIQAAAAQCRATSGAATVLLMDDDELPRAACAALLEAAGLAVVTQQAPAELPAVIDELRPDLVLLAAAANGSSPAELTELLALLSPAVDPAIAALAGEATPTGERERLLAAGVEVLAAGRDAAQLPARARRLALAHRARRLKSERRLQRSLDLEQASRAVNEHAMVTATDAEGRIFYANDRFCAIAGYRREELIGQEHSLIRSGAHPPSFIRGIWDTIAAGRSWHGTICKRARDGSHFWVETTIVPFLDSEGRPYRYVALRTDVTRLVESERANFLRSRAIEAATSGIMLADMRSPDEPIIEVNAAIETITGYRPEEFIGRNCRFLQGPDTDPAAVGELRAALREARSTEVTLLNYRKDGTPFWNQLTLSPIFDEHGQLTHVIGIQTDVTARVEAEQAEARERKRLQRAQQCANIGTWEWDPRSGDVYWTEAIAPMLGYADGELEMTFDAYVAAIHPEDREAVLAAADRCVATGEPLEIEHRVLWPDGTIAWLHEHGAVERSPDGEVLRVVGVVQDISERRRAAMELEAAREQADRANRAKSEFLSRMSHELRTPMNAVLGFAQLIEADPELPEEHRENCGEIIRAGHHLLELIDDVLDLSKIEAGHIEVVTEAVSLAPLAEECLSLVGSMARRHEVTLHQEVADEAMAWADPKRLKEAILNLLSNAIKYNHPGGQVSLRSEVQPSLRRICIHVVDTGTGIPEDKLERLYEPFERLGADSTAIEGTGIGLSITRRLVDLMAGSISVQTAAGRGSTFTIELPLAGALHPSTSVADTH